MQVFELGGDVVSPQLANSLMRLIAEGGGEEDEQADTELRAQAVRSYLDLLDKPKLSPVLLKVSPATQEAMYALRLDPWQSLLMLLLLTVPPV